MNRRFPLLFWLSCLFAFAAAIQAQETPSTASDESESEEQETLEDLLENTVSTDGLFAFHQDQEDGTLYLEISADQIGPEFIHFSHTLDGVTSVGLFRGQFSSERIFTIRRHFDRIEFVAPNTSFFFDPESALSRASSANISDAVIASVEIVSEDEETGRILIKADELFLDESFRQIRRSPRDDDDDSKRFRLGDLSDDRTRFLAHKSFADNSLVRVQYVFADDRPKKRADEDVADSRYVTIEVQHTFIAVPQNDYVPRFADARVGYFSSLVTDLTSKSSAPYRDLIHRWHLVKADPDAPISDPVEPLTWWIENTTPVELRDTVRDGVLAWNLAFESAGISNALAVEIQPDDADWDADDVNYHVLRWTSSPNPPFGGYGPSFVNPRTGQILGADIMLEYIFMTNRVRLRDLLEIEPAASPLPEFFHSGRGACRCQFGHYLHQNRLAASTILRFRSPREASLRGGPLEMDDLLTQALTDLVLHEIGHTLGLTHNFRSSNLYDREEIHNTELTSKTGIISSVMDYAPANISIDRERQGQYFSTVPGPYDHWAIRYGYGAEEQLPAVLAASTLPEHAYGNDADDMRRPGRGIDPEIMINDLTSEPIAYARDQIQFARETLVALPDSYPVAGESYHEMTTAVTTLLRYHQRAAETISRYIGGVKVDRSLHAQPGSASEPLIPVSGERQREAMAALDAEVFGAGAFAFDAELIAKLQLQARGFEFFDLDNNEDPKIHARVLAIQKGILDQLLHPNTLTRVLDSALYGNDYQLEEMMTDLHESILAHEPKEPVSPFREALQIEYVNRLVSISGLQGSSEYPVPVQSQAIHLLEEVDLANRRPIRHVSHLRRLIEKALNDD
ncbi:MAG: zinc-dependent metalloprotease [Verrucomicrobiota bacterium]